MKNFSYIVCGLTGFFLVAWSLGIVPVDGKSVVAQEAAQEQAQPAGFQYAELRINGNQYVFDISGNRVIPRQFDLNSLYRFLGGRQRPSFVNVLGKIGDDGWQLIDVSPDRKTYTFAR